MASYRRLLFSRELTHTRNRPNRIRFLWVSSEPRPFDDKQTEIVALEIIFAAEARFPPLLLLLLLHHQFFFHHRSVYFPIKQTALGISFQAKPDHSETFTLYIKLYACARVCPFNKLCNASFRTKRVQTRGKYGWKYVIIRKFVNIRNYFHIGTIWNVISLILFIILFIRCSFFFTKITRKRDMDISFKKDRYSIGCKIFISRNIDGYFLGLA